MNGKNVCLSKSHPDHPVTRVTDDHQDEGEYISTDHESMLRREVCADNEDACFTLWREELHPDPHHPIPNHTNSSSSNSNNITVIVIIAQGEWHIRFASGNIFFLL